MGGAANEETDWLKWIKLRLRLNQGSPSTFGSERSFDPDVGRHLGEGESVSGYYIDFGLKAESPEWPPYWLETPERQLHVASVQWALGAYERYLGGEGEAWLDGARRAADHLIAIQHSGGSQDGGWQQLMPMPHTYEIPPPWLSAIAQGEGASLLARLHLETGDERYAEAAIRALAPMRVPVAEGGMLTHIDGTAPFVEEYPTDRPSCVLNGAIFALWGFYDVAKVFGDSDAGRDFETLCDSLASNLWRFDTGYWSRYDLYPHPLVNVASPAYHLLHIKQLRLLHQLSPKPEFEAAAATFDAYRSSQWDRREALGRKVAFRALVPRNAVLAHRLPWNRRRSPAKRRSRDAIVLCYHGISSEWDSALAVTPERLAAQLGHMAHQGYRGVTFEEAVLGTEPGRFVAVTFDDGYRSVFDLAPPILERFGMPGTVFLPTAYVDGERPMSWPEIDIWIGTPHEHELLPMSWEQARSLAQAGWEIGAHSVSHPHLTELGDERLAAELLDSRLHCERMMGTACRTFAYPYGDHDDRVAAAASAAGYTAACTLQLEAATNPLKWPRIDLYELDRPRRFRRKVSPSMRRLQISPAGKPLERTYGLARHLLR